MANRYHIALTATFLSAPNNLIDELRGVVHSDAWNEKRYADYVEVGITGTFDTLIWLTNTLAKLMPFVSPHLMGIYTYDGDEHVHLLLPPPFRPGKRKEPRIVDVKLGKDSNEIAQEADASGGIFTAHQSAALP